MPNHNTYLIFDFFEHEQQILSYNKQTAAHDNVLQCLLPTPPSLGFATPLQHLPSKVLALLEQYYSLKFHTYNHICGEYQQFNEQEFTEGVFASFVEHEKKNGCNNFGRNTAVLDVHIQLGIFLGELVEEEHNDEKKVHENHEGVNILVLHDDADEQCYQVQNAQIDGQTYALGEDIEVQGILELKIFVSQLQLLKQQEDEAVNHDSYLMLRPRTHY